MSHPEQKISFQKKTQASTSSGLGAGVRSVGDWLCEIDFLECLSLDFVMLQGSNRGISNSVDSVDWNGRSNEMSSTNDLLKSNSFDL